MPRPTLRLSRVLDIDNNNFIGLNISYLDGLHVLCQIWAYEAHLKGQKRLLKAEKLVSDG